MEINDLAFVACQTILESIIEWKSTMNLFILPCRKTADFSRWIQGIVHTFKYAKNHISSVISESQVGYMVPSERRKLTPCRDHVRHLSLRGMGVVTDDRGIHRLQSMVVQVLRHSYTSIIY